MFENKEVIDSESHVINTAEKSTETHKKSKKRDFSLESVMSWILLITTLLLPFFVWPNINIPMQISKLLVFVWPVLVLAVLWITGVLRKGHMEFPRLWLFASAGFVVLTYLLSSLFSDSVKSSLIGQGFEISTFATVGMLFLLFVLTTLVFKDKKKILWLQYMIFASAGVIALYHIVRFLGVLVFNANASFLSLGIFGDLAGNSIGKWSDLGVFFGLISIMSLLALEHYSFKKVWAKVVAWIFMIVGLFFVATANFSMIWYVLAAFAIISLVYAFALGYSKKTWADNDGSKLPYTSLVVLAISLIFILSNGSLGGYLSTSLRINQVDVRPTWAATTDLVKVTLSKDPVFGAGPNRFSNVWLANKPAEVNSTVFWNTDFDYAVGFIPTLLITTGILGLLAWLIFLVWYIYFAFKMVLERGGDRLSHFLMLSSFAGSLYLWFMAVVYIPSSTTLFLAFLLSGATLAVGIIDGYISKSKIEFSDSPRKSFITVLVLIIVMLGAISLAYVYGNKFVASIDFQRAMIIANTNADLVKIESLVSSAARLDANDVYYRSLAEVYLNKLVEISNSLNQSKASKVSPDQSNAIQTLLRAAFQNANSAVSLDQNNYENYLTLGKIYEYAMINGLSGSYEGASKAYNDALKLNPQSPLILLTLARLEVSKGTLDKAKEYAISALRLKNDYSDAAYLLAQVETSLGNIKNAIAALESAAVFSPNQPALYFQLGLLKYNQKDFEGAIYSLESAVKLNQYYSNALYFLGLSYSKVGRQSEAIEVFEYLQKLNPDNADVVTVLRSLRQGNVAPSVTDTKKTEAPVKEKTVTNKKDR